MKTFPGKRPDPPAVYLDSREAALICRCSVKTIERAVRQGSLRVHRLFESRRYRFRREWIHAWMDGDPPDTGTGTPSAEQARNSESGPGRF
jgi:excisionase family DNA binding protein